MSTHGVSSGTQPTVFERLELKYLVSEREARALRDAMRGVCVPDEFNGTCGRGYALTSLYLDTRSLAFHRAKLRGDHDRYKLRARSYAGSGDVHLEVKRKTRDVVHKTRARVPRAAWSEFARGRSTRVENDPLLDAFCTRLRRTGAAPTLLVHYEREAYVSRHDGYARVTFDRAITSAPCSRWEFRTPRRSWHRLVRSGERPVVLELKCETVIPRWMHALILRFGLERTGFSKYSRGVQRWLRTSGGRPLARGRQR